MNPDISSLFDRLNIPNPCRRGTIETVSSRLVSAESDLFSALASFGGAGWSCQANGVRVLSASEAPDPKLGPLLSCELHSGPRSLHVRLEGESWRIVEFQENPDGEGWLVGHEFLPSGPAGDRNLLYEVSWGVATPEEAELRPTVSRFVGFATSNS